MIFDEINNGKKEHKRHYERNVKLGILQICIWNKMIQNSRLIFQNVIQQTDKRNVTFPTIACDIEKKKKKMIIIIKLT